MSTLVLVLVLSRIVPCIWVMPLSECNGKASAAKKYTWEQAHCCCGNWCFT